MTAFQIIEARPWHCGQMNRLLRSEQKNAMRQYGFDAHRALMARFQESSFRRAWLIDGKLAALGGVAGSRIATAGHIWLALSESAANFPVAMVKEARRQLAEIMKTWPEVYTFIFLSDPKSARFARALGFDLSEREGSLAVMTMPGRKAA